MDRERRRLLDPPVRWILYGGTRWLPPRGHGLKVVAAVDRLLPATGRLYSGRMSGGFRIQCDLRDPTQKAIFYCGTYEREVSDLIWEELQRGDSFLDIGANVGYFSLLAAARVGREGRVIAFEPSAELSRRLRKESDRVTSRNPSLVPRIEVHRVALSDQRGVAVLSSAIDHRNGERYLMDIGEGELVQTESLTEYLPGLRPHVVKIDVEGAELRVLRGMDQILRSKGARLVIVETLEENLRRFGDSIEGILAHMRDRGYAGTEVPSRYSAPMVAFRKDDRD